MPNHCEQDLYVSGPKADVEALVAFVREDGEGPHAGPFSANKIVPYPDEYVRLDEARRLAEANGVPLIKQPKDGFNSGGYEWCCKHWGSKWGAYNAKVETTSRGATFHFTSAWSPIFPIIETLSHKFPSLTLDLRYFESGRGYQGKSVYRAGKCIEQAVGKYSGERGG